MVATTAPAVIAPAVIAPTIMSATPAALGNLGLLVNLFNLLRLLFRLGDRIGQGHGGEEEGKGCFELHFDIENGNGQTSAQDLMME